MAVHSPAALARSGACSIQTISSRSLPGTVTARPRLTRSAKRARIITELYPGRVGQQQVAVIETKEVTLRLPSAKSEHDDNPFSERVRAHLVQRCSRFLRRN